MKNVMSLLVLAFLIVSCNGNLGKYKTQIGDISTKWGDATGAIADFSALIQDEQSSLLNFSNSLQIDPASMQGWDEEKKARFNNIQAMTQNNANLLASMSSEVDDFMSKWIDQGKQLQVLQDGVSTGKLEGDVQAKITSLTTAVSEAMSKLESWKSEFNEIKTAITNSSDLLKELKITGG